MRVLSGKAGPALRGDRPKVWTFSSHALLRIYGVVT